MHNFIFTVLIFIFSSLISFSYACTATNNLGDTCETNCRPGEIASCINGSDANAPSCSCSNSFTYSKAVTDLPKEQQEAITKIMINNGLLRKPGQLAKFSENDIPAKIKSDLEKSLKESGIKLENQIGAFNIQCMGARIAEAAAVAACASIPGGQIAIAACVVAAHEIANAACQ